MHSSVIAILFFLSGYMLPQHDPTNKIITLLKAGNTKALSTHFTTKIDLAVPGTDDVYSRAQAELILKKFFIKNQPSEVTIVHQGTSKLGIQYRIGSLKTSTGEYRLSFNMKKDTDKFYIQQFRIEENDADF